MPSDEFARIYASMVERNMPCPCNPAVRFHRCCAPYLYLKKNAPSPEALMRSRYTAYTCNDESYVLGTWHPDTRPSGLDLAGDDHTTWTRLNVLSAQRISANDTKATVHFEAFFVHDKKLCVLTENSQFERINSEWFYVDGKVETRLDLARNLGRNAPCPCGSGLKYKRCCAIHA